MRASVAFGSVALLASMGCGADDGGVEATGGPQGAPSAGTRYRGTLTVLENAEHGPQLCSAVNASLPPQCGGPDVVGWDWDDAPGAESANGTSWGSFEVTGTWDGERLTLTDPPGPPRDDTADDDVAFSSPCPEPPGGWGIVAPAATNDRALNAAAAMARARPDFGGVWIDQSVNPAAADPIDGLADEMAVNDPTKLVLNVRVAGDVADAERDLRTVWGGSLCVSPAERTLEELASITHEIAGGGGVESTGIDESRGVVEVTVFVDGGLQAEYDESYGAGTVAVAALLQPID